MRKLICLGLLVPTVALGQNKLEFPKWTVKDNDACYNFEQAKQLKFAEQTCLEYEEYYFTTEPLKRELVKELTEQNSTLTAMGGANEELLDTVAKLQNERDAAVRAEARAKSHSIFGGGAAWLITAGIGGIAGGFALGYFISK